MDGQGTERARPYLEAAGATYPAVIDADGVTGRLYGFKTVASGFLIDERGDLVYSKINGFSIHRPELADLVSCWVAESEVTPFEETDDLYLQIPRGATDRRAIEIYRRGAEKYRQGDKPGAAALMRTAFSIDRPELADLVSCWVAESEVTPFEETDDLYLQIPRGATDRRAIEIYRRGAEKYRQGDKPGAAALMREAMRLDPDSIIVHRNAWAIESPERFYDGDIDQEWKQEQLRKGC